MFAFLCLLALALILLAACWDVKKDRAFEREITRQLDESAASQAELQRRIRNIDHMTVNRADERTNPGEKNYVRD